MFRSYKQLPIPATHQRALAVGMSPHSRIFFAFVFSITTFVVVLHSTAAYNSFHNSAIRTLENVSTAARFQPIGAVSPVAPWKSILRLGATQPRIGTCTVAHGEHKQGYQRALKTHLSHGGYHKYPMYLLDRPVLSGLWSKEGALLEVLLQELSKPQGKQLEWLFWLDADTVIMNKLIPLETFLPPEERNDVNLLYTKDWNGLNNGVFALRVSTWSLEFLSSILAYRTFRPEEDLPFTEQSAMGKVMHMDKYEKGAVQCPPQWFNSYPGDGDEGDVHFDHRPGQLLVHFAGVGDKAKAIDEWIDKLDANRSHWEVPLSETNYGRQIELFWQGLEEERLQHQDETTIEGGAVNTEQEKADEAKANEIVQKTASHDGDDERSAYYKFHDSRKDLWDGLVI